MKIEMLSAITTDNGAINLHLNPAVGLLVIAGILIVLGILAWGGFSLFSKYFTGWKTLAQRFPATEVHKTGKKYSGRDGHFDAPSWNRPFHLDYYFTIEIAQEGLLISTCFWWCAPVLIPWGDVQKVDDTEVLGSSDVSISVNYGKERRATFGLPKEALAAIQESVSAEKLHKTGSLSQLIKNRIKPDA